MISNTVFDAHIIDIPKIHNEAGNISVIDNHLGILPFDIKRVYYLYDIPGGEERGGHAHKELQQLIIAACGSFDLILDDGMSKRKFHLNRPNVGVYVPSGLWRELKDFSSGAICLVLASHTYDEYDYFREFKLFESWKSV